MQKELDYLDGAVAQPKRPFAAIVGGSKVSSKIGVIETLINKVDKIFLGGGMIFTFYKAQGKAVGASLVEEDKLELAKELMAMAEKKGVQFILPTDVIVADKFAADAKTQVVSIDNIPEGWMGLDIGPDSLKAFQAALSDCKQVIWNGPMVKRSFFFVFERGARGETLLFSPSSGANSGEKKPSVFSLERSDIGAKEPSIVSPSSEQAAESERRSILLFFDFYLFFSFHFYLWFRDKHILISPFLSSFFLEPKTKKPTRASLRWTRSPRAPTASPRRSPS